MTTQQQLDAQFEDIKRLAFVCFLNDVGATSLAGLDERELIPLLHAAGFITPGTNLLDDARCERVMARLHQIHSAHRESILQWLKRSAN